MQIESWKEKFFKLAEIYLTTHGKLQFALGELKCSSLELHCKYQRLTATQEEALKDEARGGVAKLIDNRSEDAIKVGNNLLKSSKVMEMRKKRKAQIAKKIIDFEV